jgi:hypothetical protein
MIPLMLIIKIRQYGEKRRGFHLWLPLFLVWIIVAPFAVLLTPFVWLTLLFSGHNPVKVSAAGLALLTGFSGTRVEIESPDALVFIRVV